MTAGGGVVFTLDVRNNGPAPADGVVVNDQLPAALTLVSATSSQLACTIAANAVTCTKATMAVGETATISITATVASSVTAGQTINNVATVATTTTDPVPSNNTDDSAITIESPPAPIASPPTPIVSLPVTGGSPWRGVAIGLVVLAGGLALVVASRRRRSA